MSLIPSSLRRALLVSPLLLATGWATAAGPTLLNVSYDVAREFFKEINPAFQKQWKQASGEDLTINQSHGGSSKQARAVIDGLEADVVTMNQSSDIDAIATRGKLIPEDWAKRLPNNAAPTTSVTVILVRKGNPKKIADWPDLAKPGVSVVIPNPKVTGNGRYSYVAAWGSAIKAGGTPAQARDLVQKIFANVPVFDGGGRAATTTFAQRNIGDALATFESEVNLIKAEFGDNFDVVYPKSTILAENPVSVIDTVVDKKGTRKQAEAYLKFLWSDEAQEIAAKHQLRPRSAALLSKYAKDFPKVNTFTIDEVFGGWSKAQKEHFDDGGIYDQILAARK
ncbi:MAG: sulfate ABC transporter substrate-binding protein [Methylibium sp.]|jgi:sulfate transport system substrate-binding protein|uniref:sulfate ABC transporter substrate-binding protein n=1 Tax=unclassified Methylibium TaxID=2633235 RepID=UPI0006F7B9AF|nr:sulfate ABC transporter substrate-binding protein [Methylibium sp. Root1272]KQW68788.1 thiosulfate transporter subunit [Methylibium sp. Root1272]MDP1790101.1 sulfate ABC transporter substrate-binding protein [Methylibium sp.]